MGDRYSYTLRLQEDTRRLGRDKGVQNLLRAAEPGSMASC
jgi:hypothetical protein